MRRVGWKGWAIAVPSWLYVGVVGAYKLFDLFLNAESAWGFVPLGWFGSSWAAWAMLPFAVIGTVAITVGYLARDQISDTRRDVDDLLISVSIAGGIGGHKILPTPQAKKKKARPQWLTNPLYVNGHTWKYGKVVITNRENAVMQIMLDLQLTYKANEKSISIYLHPDSSCVMEPRDDFKAIMDMPTHGIFPMEFRPFEAKTIHLEFSMTEPEFEHFVSADLWNELISARREFRVTDLISQRTIVVPAEHQKLTRNTVDSPTAGVQP